RRDTCARAVEGGKVLHRRSWKRYLLVTSAVHIPRSMLAFKSKASEPVPAPGDFSLVAFEPDPFRFFPNEGAAWGIFISLHEYIGIANYYWRVHFSKDS